VLVVKSLKGLGVALLSSLDSVGFVELRALPLSFLLSIVWSSVGQNPFPGRIP
jgi:hypothetical protein